MDTAETESLHNLADPELVARLGCTDWNDPEYIKEEQLVQLLQIARAEKNSTRLGVYSHELSRRISLRALKFAHKNYLVPRHFSHIDDATHEVAGYVWERLLKGKNMAFAARRFGVFFRYQAISYLRWLIAQNRLQTESLEEWHQAGRAEIDDENSAGPQDDADATLQDEWTPDLAFGYARGAEQVHARLQSLLTRNEYSVFVMLWRQQMKVKDIAAALGVTPRTINNHTRSIKYKINKEFNV